MKKFTTIIALTFAIGPMFAANADGLIKGAVKLKAADKIVNNNHNDSGLKKAVKLKAVSNTANSNDSGLKRAVKYKVIKEM